MRWLDAAYIPPTRWLDMLADPMHLAIAAAGVLGAALLAAGILAGRRLLIRRLAERDLKTMLSSWVKVRRAQGETADVFVLDTEGDRPASRVVARGWELTDTDPVRFYGFVLALRRSGVAVPPCVQEIERNKESGETTLRQSDITGKAAARHDGVGRHSRRTGRR